MRLRDSLHEVRAHGAGSAALNVTKSGLLRTTVTRAECLPAWTEAASIGGDLTAVRYPGKCPGTAFGTFRNF
jgi:hypothetical protein